MSGPGVWGRLVPERVRESYLLKFVLALGVVFVATAVVGGYAVVQTDRTLDRQVAAELRTAATDEATTVENWLDERARLARMLSEFDGVSKNQSGPVSLFLQREKRNLPADVFRIHVINGTSGAVFATNAPAVVQANLLSRVPWGDAEFGFSQEDDAVYRSQVYRTDGVPVVAFVTPVPNYPRRFLVVTTTVESVVSNFDKPIDGSFTRIVDGEGTVVVDQRHRATLDPYFANGTAPVVAAGSDGAVFRPDGPADRSLDADYVLASAPVEGTDWTVVVHVPERGAYELRRTVSVHLLALLAVAVLGIGFIGATIGRNTVAALDTLSTKARALERGELDVDLESDRVDEIGDLFVAFRAMRDSLQDRIDRLSTARDDAERARQRLAETNRNLEEQRVIISVLNRLLTHNLRNSMSIVVGHAAGLADRLSGADAEDAETIRRTAAVTVRRIEKSKQVERVVGSGDRDRRVLDLTAVVESIADQFRQQYPAADVRTDLPEACPVLADESVGFVVDNLVENAIEHNDDPEPSVWITLETSEGPEDGDRSDPVSTHDGVRSTLPDADEETAGDDRAVWLRIEDDGPGIPEMEVAALERERETKLEHGSGMGLWLVNWLVDHLGGTLTFEERDPRGTTVVVRLEAPGDAQRSGAQNVDSTPSDEEAT